MRFACEHCQTRYSIADERVADRVVKMRCQKCGETMVVRGPSKNETAAPLPSPSAALSNSPAWDSESTQIASLADIERIRKEAAQAHKSSLAPAATKASATSSAGPDWFVMIDSKQVGPLAADELTRRINNGVLNARHYAWRAGLGDWARLGTIAEWQSLFEGAKNAGEKNTGEKNTVAPDPSRPMVPSGAGPMAASPPPLSPPKRPPPLQVAEKSATAPTASTAAAKGMPPPSAASAPWDDPETVIFKVNKPKDPAPLAELFDDPTSVEQPPGKPKGKVRDGDLADALGLFEETAALSGPEGAGTATGALTEATAVTSSPVVLAGAHVEKGAPVDPVGNAQPLPAESTGAFYAASGLGKRQRRRRMAVFVVIAAAVLVVVVIGLDLGGVIEIPGVSRAYQAVGIDDPHQPDLTPAFASNLTEEERQRLRDGLMGNKKKAAHESAEGDASPSEAPAGKAELPQKDLGSEDHSATHEAATAAPPAHPTNGPSVVSPKNVLDENNKPEPKVEALPTDAPVDGSAALSAEQIARVVQSNQKAIKLCLDSAIKKAETPSGRLEVEFTVNGRGTVDRAEIKTAKWKGSTLGGCVESAVKGWRFPRFAGEPVTVAYPLILSASL